MLKPKQQLPRPINLVIVGTQRAATTSLQNYLSQHPKIISPNQREIGFFINNKEYYSGYANLFHHYYSNPSNDSILLAKSVWIMTMSEAVKRLKAHNPEVQIIVILRHPIERAFSSYKYAIGRGWEDRTSFEEAIFSSNKMADDHIINWNLKYLETSQYADHIELLTKQFNKRQIHIFLYKDLFSNTLGICRSIFSIFDDLDPNFTPQINKKYNQASAYRVRWLAQLTSTRTYMRRTKNIVRYVFPRNITRHSRNLIRKINEQTFNSVSMKDETRQYLIEYFRPYNKRLEKFIDRDLSFWNK